MEIERVVELYVPGRAGADGSIGSGYRLGDELVLTAGHVVAGLPTHPADTPVPDSVDAAGGCRARQLGEHSWTAAVVAWRDQAADVAVLRLAAGAPPLPPASPAPRWGRVNGTDPVAVSAVGFPWAQERPDRVRDSEHVFGFLAPGTTVKTGQFSITVLTSPPSQRPGGSPWAGMSGAALFSGPFLIGVLVIDPARFADRVVAAPLAPVLADPGLVALLRTQAQTVTAVEPRPRLAVTADTSVAIAPPYSPVDEELGQQQPARLLLPEHGIVPFLGRDQQLQTLQDWCLDERSWALRLLLGAGGSGKTRLAAEACVRLAGHGWQAGLADPDAPGGDPVLALDRATLLVIDDADLNVPLLEKLVRRLAYWPPDAPPVRLLLLARHDQPWWDTLNRDTHHLPEDHAAPPLSLEDGALLPSERADQHVRALTAFTRHLTTSAVAEEVAEQPAPNLGDAAFANPLLVHMHALLAATGAGVPTFGNAVRERVLDAVLDGERYRWKQTFPQAVRISGETARQQVVATATLLAPPDQPATTALLSLVEDLAEAGAVDRRSVANWLHQRYPGAEPPWAAPLRPDLLTEQLLTTCPGLTDLVLAGYDRLTSDDYGDGGVEQMLTELTRAAGRDPVRQALDQLLDARLPDLLDAAIAQPAGRLPDLLDRALTVCPQPQAAAAVVRRLPVTSTGLAALAATVTTQAVDHYRGLVETEPDAHTSDLSWLLNSLSLRLADLNRAEDALPPIEEAVGLRRGLASAHPDEHMSGLARSLKNLSNRLAALGRADDALAASEESISLYRLLVVADSDEHAAALARSLHTLALRLASLRRPGDALAAIEESVTLYRDVVVVDPTTYLPELAMAQNNWSSRLAALHRAEQALTVSEESVGLYRGLVATDPDAHTPALATALITVSAALGALGRDRDAVDADRESVALYRTLHARDPDRYRAPLMTALRRLAIDLQTQDHDTEANQVQREVAELGG